MNQINLSVIVPVLHEGNRINDLVDHLILLDSQKTLEIVIVDGCQEKDTLTALHNENVIKISSEPGRAKQMNAGASGAKGEILIFLHADTELPASALRWINSFMGKKEYVAGAFDLGIKSEKLIFKVIAAVSSFRSRLSRIPFGDQALFIRREYFNRIGGYKEIPLMEDVELMRRIKRSGEKIWIIPESVMTSARRWEKEGVVYCTLRNWTLQILYSLGVSPDKLARFYKSSYRRE